MKIRHIILLVFLLSGNVFAQPILENKLNKQYKERPTERELLLQKVFIEANKEKLLGNFEDAIYLFKEVIGKDKKNDVAFFELAKLYALSKEEDKAVRAVKDALDLNRDNLWYNLFYADLLMQQNNYQNASSVYEQLIKAYPDNEDLYFEQAYILTKAEKPEQAIKVYDLLESRTGVNPDISKQKYDLYMRMNKPAKAEEVLLTLVEAHSYDSNYHLILADHYERIGKKDKAVAVYKKILTIDPEQPNATLALAEMYEDKGETANYLKSMQGVFSNPDVSIDLKIQEIVPYIKLVSETDDGFVKKEAIRLTQILTETHPNEAKAFSVHGDMLNYCDKPEQALTQYKQAVELKSNAFVVWEQIFFINSALNQPDQLHENTEAALELFPNQPSVYFFNGLAKGQLKKHKEAVETLEEALLMVGKNQSLKEQILIQIGVNYHGLNKYTKSDEAFEQVLAINDKNPLALNNYGYYLAVRGEQMERAEKMVLEATKLSPNDPSIQDTYGWILYKKKKYKEAQKWIRKALDSGAGNNPTVLENYGDVLYKLDDVEEAVKYWQLAQEKGANSEVLDKKIAERKLYE